MPDRAAVIAALDAVTDPKSGQGLMAAGLVQGLVVADDRAGFALEVPAGDTALYAPVRDAAEAALKAIPGMARVSVVLTAEAVATPPRRRTAGLSPQAVDQGRAESPRSHRTPRPCAPRAGGGQRQGRGGQVHRGGQPGLRPGRAGPARRAAGRRRLRPLGPHHAGDIRQARL